MSESKEFLESLAHDNPERPRFTINNGNLEISLKGNAVTIPMAEVLGFAGRWNADFEKARDKARLEGRMMLYPYSLLNTRLTDPDAQNIRWD